MASGMDRRRQLTRLAAKRVSVGEKDRCFCLIGFPSDDGAPPDFLRLTGLGPRVPDSRFEASLPAASERRAPYRPNVGSSGSHAVARKCLLRRRRCSGGRRFGRSCCGRFLARSSRVASFMSSVASLVASRPPRLASVHSVGSGCLGGRGGGCSGLLCFGRRRLQRR